MVLCARLMSTSISGLMMSQLNKLMAVAGGRANLRAVLLHISGSTTLNLPMSARASIAMCLFVIPQSNLRCASSDLEFKFMLLITTCLKHIWILYSTRRLIMTTLDKQNWMMCFHLNWHQTLPYITIRTHSLLTVVMAMKEQHSSMGNSREYTVCMCSGSWEEASLSL